MLYMCGWHINFLENVFQISSILGLAYCIENQASAYIFCICSAMCIQFLMSGRYMAIYVGLFRHQEDWSIVIQVGEIKEP